METQTHIHFGRVKKICADIFFKKMKDYGPAWKVLRPISITDQIFIKAQRIKSVLEKKVQKVDEPIKDGFIAIFNYAAIGLIQTEIEEKSLPKEETDTQNIGLLYEMHVLLAEKMMALDPGYKAWREMRIDSLADLILMKLIHLRGVEDGQDKAVLPDVRKATYYELINHASFAIMKIEEE